jgi:ArsR family transcriptional regulator
MKNITLLFRLLSDATRLRILMLLSREELCVCQLMGVLGISQPLVSRNLALLWNADLLDERREGKLIFYRARKGMPEAASKIMEVLRTQLKNDSALKEDIRSLEDCREYQKKAGACDMKTFLAFMDRQKKKRK